MGSLEKWHEEGDAAGVCDGEGRLTEVLTTGGEAFREAMEVAIPRRTEAFAPDVVVISVHFDGHNRNSLGNLNLVEADYVWVTRSLTPRASRSAQYGAERP